MFSLKATIGIDFLSKTMYLEDRTVRLQLWLVNIIRFFSLLLKKLVFLLIFFLTDRDTAGQERFRLT